jgi:hypothetical protein
MAKRIEDIEGIRLENKGFSDALASGVEQLKALQALEGQGIAHTVVLSTSVHSFNVLMTAAATICQRSATQGDAEIDLVTDMNGTLIYRCKHDPAHEWDLDGKVIR